MTIIFSPANRRRLDGHFSTEEDGTRLDLFPDLRKPCATACPFAGARSDRFRPGRSGASGYDLISTTSRNSASGRKPWVYNRGWLKADRGVLASPKIRPRPPPCHAKQRHTRHCFTCRPPLWQRDERMDGAAHAGSPHLRRLSRQPKRPPGRGDPHRPFIAAASGAISSAATRKPTGCNKAHAGAVSPPGRPPALPARALVADLYRRPTTPTGTACSAGCTCRTRAPWCGTTSSNWSRTRPPAARPAPLRSTWIFGWPNGNPARSAALQIALRDDGLAFRTNCLSSYPLRQFRRHAAPLPRALSRQDRPRPESRTTAKALPSAHDIVRFKHPISAAPTSCPTPCRVPWHRRTDGARITDYRRRQRLQPAGIANQILWLAATVITVTWQLTGLAGGVQHRAQSGDAQLRRFPRPLPAGRWQHSPGGSASR